MKAIETVYNGYRFRSRLEARWAMFFDGIGMRYEYEAQGYELNDGTKYLPDFFLSEVGINVEVKPSRVNCLDEYHKKCEMFSKSTNTPIMLCFGDPAQATYKTIFGFQSDENGNNLIPFEWNALFYSDKSARTSIVVRDIPGKVFCDGLSIKNPSILMNDELFDKAMDQAYWLQGFSSEVSAWAVAARSARQARFEHGEYGR